MNNIVLLVKTTKLLEKADVIIGPRRPEHIGLGYLAASLEKNGFNTKILNGNISKKDIINFIETYNPWVIGFSTYTHTFNNSIDLAEVAKNRAQELGYQIIVVFGGYHISSSPEDMLPHPVIDYTVIGEGDVSMVELLTAIKNKKPIDQIAGIAFNKNGIFVKTPTRNRLRNLDQLPWPKRQPSKGKVLRAELAFPPPSHQKNSFHVMHSRGCPFNCSFCDSKNTWGGQIYFRKPPLVLKEIRSLHDTYGTNYVGFIDLTFNASKKQVISLCDEFIKENLPVHWYALCRLDLFDEEMIEAMAKAKCTKVSVGIESPNTSTAKNIKDKYSPQKHKIENILKTLNDFGIIIRAFMIIGFPHETEEIINGYVFNFLQNQLDELRVTIATPFPKTQLWNNCLNNRLLRMPPQWDDFTTEKLVFNHPFLDSNDLRRLQKTLIRNFYLNDAYKEHMLRKVKQFPRLKKSWQEFLEFLAISNYFHSQKEVLKKMILSLNTYE